MKKTNLTYMESVHRYGRIWGITVGVALLLFPLALSIIFGAAPNFEVLLKGKAVSVSMPKLFPTAL